MKPLHDMLARQLARLGLDEGLPPDAPRWQKLLARVSQAYAGFDQERYLLHRSQDIAAREMRELNAELQRERDMLETRVRERTAELAASEARFRSFTSLGSDWYWEQDADLRFTSIAGNIALYPGHSVAGHLGKTRWELPEYDPPAEGWEAHRRLLDAHQPFHDVVLRFRLPNGGRAYSSISGEPVFTPEGAFAGYRGIGRDITEQKLAEENIRRLARFDTLTGLANRASLFEHVDHAIARCRRHGRMFAVLFIDLDRFKDVNDAFGHATGDDVLRTMARRLQAAIRVPDSAARIGGDEFVVVAEEFERPELIAEFATRLLDALGDPVVLHGQECRVGASIGVALFPADGDDAQALLKRADVAMYRAKEAGRNTFAFFAGQDRPASEERMVLAASLRRAIDADQLLLHYQPKVSLRTGTMTGVEALLRWPHPERGLLLPDTFIQLAEDAGLIRPLGRWALRVACRQAREWSRASPDPFPVSVNLSARQFGDDRLVDEVAQALRDSGLPPHLLELEITESAMMEHPERAAETLQELRALGVRFSVDDFGTGFSSLARLKKFPLASVKIDRSFVGDLPHDADDAAITTAVIAMAHSLRLAVVAEGVETAAQVRFLRERNCDEVQGFFFAKPLPAAEVLAFQRRRASPHVAAIGF
ncbi:MAG TPA: EAL domain-containing protein [Casimicrobiaceae bacterium]|nr:EAL domain-containing protein [Casimicrobiaceae bacterium]